MNIESLPSGYVSPEVFAEVLQALLMSDEKPLLCYYIASRSHGSIGKKWQYARAVNILSSKRLLYATLSENKRVEGCESIWLETIISILEDFLVYGEFDSYPLTVSGWSSDSVCRLSCKYGGGGQIAGTGLQFVRDWKSYSKFRDALLTAVETRRAGGDVEMAVHRLLAARDGG